MCELPNDIIRVICSLSTSFTRSKLCQVNKQYYHVIITLTRDKLSQFYHHHVIRDYHLFILSNKQLSTTYLTDGNIDVDVAKLIWKYKHARLKRCYDILFNAYRCGNIEYINFIQPKIYKLSLKRHQQWNQARLRGAIAGGNVSFVRMLWVNFNSVENFWYAYAYGNVDVIKLIKTFGHFLDAECVSQIYGKKRADVLCYEYNIKPDLFNKNMVIYIATRKRHLPLLKLLIDTGVKFNNHNLQYAKARRCNNEFIQLMLNNTS